jgi:hypothetical protein
MPPLRKRTQQSRKAGHSSLQKRAKFTVPTISSPNNLALDEPLDKKVLEEGLEPGLKLESLGEEEERRQGAWPLWSDPEDERPDGEDESDDSGKRDSESDRVLMAFRGTPEIH